MEACGSQVDLLSQGLDPQHLVGLISADKKEGTHDDQYVYKDDITTGWLRICHERKR